MLGNLGGLKMRNPIVPGAGVPSGDGKLCRIEGGGGALVVDCTPEEARVAPGILLRGAAARTDQPEMPRLGLALIAIDVHRGRVAARGSRGCAARRAVADVVGVPRARSATGYRAQLATLVERRPTAPAGARVKFDGYRIGCELERGGAPAGAGAGKDWTAQFPEVAAAAARAPVRSALLDGEVAVVLPDGRTSFQALQNASVGGRALVYFAFDLLDSTARTRRAPLGERKARAGGGSSRARGGVLRYAPHVVGGGAECSAPRAGRARGDRLEADDPVPPGRNAGWLKTSASAARSSSSAASPIPRGGARARRAARRGTTRRRAAVRGQGRHRLHERLGAGAPGAARAASRAECPFTSAPRGWLGKNAHWVRPELVAEVAFTEWTGDGKIRHPSFQGLRADKRARGGRARAAAAAPRAEPAAPVATAVAASRATRRRARHRRRPRGRRGPDLNPGPRRLPGPRRHEGDVARYYEAVARAMLPHLRAARSRSTTAPRGSRASAAS